MNAEMRIGVELRQAQTVLNLAYLILTLIYQDT
jgi:hypothetical protein